MFKWYYWKVKKRCKNENDFQNFSLLPRLCIYSSVENKFFYIAQLHSVLLDFPLSSLLKLLPKIFYDTP